MTLDENQGGTTRMVPYNKLAAHWVAAAYDHKKNWDIMAQPASQNELVFDEDDYVEIAEQANDAVEAEVSHFCQEHRFSTITVEQKAFTAYEQGTYTTPQNKQGKISFREFLHDYAEKTSQSTSVDLMVLSSSVKGLESARRKAHEKGDLPRDIIDYSRTMLVPLKGRATATKDSKSLKTLARLIQCMEGDVRTRAHKNLFWLSHDDTGFRAYKALWLSTVPEHKPRAGQQILTEVKIEHESQMEIDRATRPFLAINRNVKRAREHFENVVRDFGSDTRRAQKAIKDGLRHTKNSGEVGKWSKWLYARVNENAGLNIFRKPDLTDEEKALYSAPTFSAIVSEIKGSKTVSQKGIVNAVINALINSQVIPPKEARRLKPRADI